MTAFWPCHPKSLRSLGLSFLIDCCDTSGSVSPTNSGHVEKGKFRELFCHKPAPVSFTRGKFNQTWRPLMQAQDRQPQVKGRSAHDRSMARASRAETLPGACAVWKVKGKNWICRPHFLPCTGHLRPKLWLPGCLRTFCHFFPLLIRAFLCFFFFFFRVVVVCKK